MPTKYRKLVLTICYTESNLNYDVKHSDKDTIGICGIKTKFYKDVLNSVDANSLFAGYLVLKHLDFDIKKYKGTVNNYKSYYRVKKIYRGIK